jgi:hypothetical protein
MLLKKAKSVGKKLNKKDLLSTNLATKKSYCTQRVVTVTFVLQKYITNYE